MSPEDHACALVARAMDIQGEVSIEDDMESLAAWTSLTHVRLVLELEGELGRPLGALEVGSLISVRSVAALLAKDRMTP